MRQHQIELNGAPGRVHHAELVEGFSARIDRSGNLVEVGGNIQIGHIGSSLIPARSVFAAKLRIPVRIVSPNANGATIGTRLEEALKRRDESKVNRRAAAARRKSQKCPDDRAFCAPVKCR